MLIKFHLGITSRFSNQSKINQLNIKVFDIIVDNLITTTLLQKE